MKTIALVLALMIVSCTTFAQVYKFRTFQTSTTQYGSTTAWNEVSIPVIINLNKYSLQIYSRETQDIDLTKVLSNNYDSNGNNWIRFQGVDADGIACVIELEIFNDQSGRHCATLFLEYSDVNINYRLQKS